jgi:MULE transposase domain
VIATYIEKKYPLLRVSYGRLYSMFRRANPLFKTKDLDHFHSFLTKLNANISYFKDPGDKLNRLFFTTPTMEENFKNFGDIVIVDSTYNTNLYKVPLFIISGVDNKGNNIIFAMAFLNNEDTESFGWIFKQWLQRIENPPHIIFSDEDKALCRAIKEELKSTHLLCKWHISRNLRRNYAAVEKKNKEIYDLILKMPNFDSKDTFEENYLKIKEFLTQEKNEKGLNNIQRLYEMKEQYCDAYRDPLLFTAGITTTSRAESMNCHIKRYVSSKSEISGIINFIEEVENDDGLEKLSSKAQVQNKNTQENIEENENKMIKKESPSPEHIDPYILQLTKELGKNILKKHIKEFIQSNYYRAKIDRDEDQDIQGTVWRETENSEDTPQENSRVVTIKENQHTCQCLLFIQEGVLCRHFFKIARRLDLRSIITFIHPRWTAKHETSIHQIHDKIQKSYIEELEKTFKKKQLDEEMEELDLEYNDWKKVIKEEGESSDEDLEDDNIVDSVKKDSNLGNFEIKKKKQIKVPKPEEPIKKESKGKKVKEQTPKAETKKTNVSTRKSKNIVEEDISEDDDVDNTKSQNSDLSYRSKGRNKKRKSAQMTANEENSMATGKKKRTSG